MTVVTNSAQVKISCKDLDKEVHFFSQLGFTLQQVFPADNPRIMVVAAFDLVLSIEQGLSVNDLTVILPNNSSQSLKPSVSPSGVKVEFQPKRMAVVPELTECAVVKFNHDDSWVTGRAGMLYRDLIPDRLAGAIIASNIKIVAGGPVPDHVHYHSILFQLIFCTKGWVKVVYEDQGDPFILKAGDCVTQPPGIRHQVLEASDGLEVLEIGLPAEHMTTLDYQLKLPTTQFLPDRLYDDGTYREQKFCRHQQSTANWVKCDESQLLFSETAVTTDSSGLAAVNVIQSTAENECDTWVIKHRDSLRFYYLMTGQVRFQGEGGEYTTLNERDSFLVAADQLTTLSQFSSDFQCIEFIWLNP